MTTIPSVPTPPMPGKSRDVIYGIWAWLSVASVLASSGWAVVGDVPIALLVASVVLNGFGALTGFLAKNNVTE